VIRVTYTIDAPFLGGAEHYVGNLALGLDRRHFAASVLMRSNDVDGALLEWSERLSSGGVPVVRVPMRLPFRPWDAIGIYRALGALRPDIVHVNMPGPYNGQMGLLAPIARLTGARVVVTEHLPMVARLWKRALVKSVAIRFVDAAVTMSRANADYLARRQGFDEKRIRVVRNGVPLAYGAATRDVLLTRREMGFQAHDVALVFVGNLLPHKGLLATIEALSSLKTLPWKLAVIGSGPDEAAARVLSERYGVSNRVAYLGRRSPEAVEQIVGACDALVLPSEVEGLPYVILEAMALSKPVVATRVYGIPEAVRDGETGLLVAPRNVGELANALRTVVENGGLRERMGRAGRAVFEESFTLERQLAEMSTLYRALAKGKRSDA
jgi:glycosyltransferase involved in cell wall biosynthesis